MCVSIDKMKLYNNLMNLNKLSKIFQPINVIPKNAKIKKQDMTSNSQRLMLDLGIIRQANPGNFHYLPLGLRALEKLTRLVDNEMSQINAQKMILPTLTNTNLWKTTGRLDTGGNELFILKDRHNKSYVLSPTHEESITDLLASISPVSYKQFPLRLYQMTSKYRDEIKPRFGLMRGRQFIMKDLYTFDIDEISAKDTYAEVCKCYDRIFDKIGVKYVKVLGTTGNIGGTISHEYHLPADIGEDRLLICEKCNYTANIEVCGVEKCPQCKSNDKILCKSGIEVAHTFLLGDKYSNPLNAKYLGIDNKSYNLQMGCYGLGISRLLAASVEVLSDENEIRWPLAFAPYSVIIIPPKAGSKEESHTDHLTNQIYSTLTNILQNDILIDDRTHLTIGRRVFDAKHVGYPFIIIIGNSSMQNPPQFEFHDLTTNTKNSFTENQLFNYIKNKILK